MSQRPTERMSIWEIEKLPPIERIRECLKMPDPEDEDDLGNMQRFDPWTAVFPALYGTYNSEFDDAALDVLHNISVNTTTTSERIEHEMLREMLCTQGLCDYGTSPRGCWAEPEFLELLPEIIRRWKIIYQLRWGSEPS